MKTLFSRLAFVALAMTINPVAAAESISPEALAERIEKGNAPLIIDVRTEEAYLEGHIPGARLIPHDRMGEYVESLSAHKDQPVVLYCRTGNRSGKAAKVLEDAGFSQVIVMEGGYPDWPDQSE
jgi:phage shock protein E